MWVLTTFFAITTFILLWLCAGYFVVMRFVGIVRRRSTAVGSSAFPRLSVIVPCHNEAPIILDKLRNLLELDYPRFRLEIIFVDGQSSDDTVALIRKAANLDRRVRVLDSPDRGKIHQLNHALPHATGEIVVVTDADGIMPPESLRKLAAEFVADDGVAVVGAYSRPSNTIWRDRCFWDSQNRGRLIESDAHASSIVIATCYAFRRELLRQFPDDVVADDVYIALLAHSRNRRVIYSRAALVTETRGPSSISEFLSHKFRKNNAFLRESLRFIYRLPDMNGTSKLMLLTRTAQQLLLPYCAAVWAFLALTLLTLGRHDLLMMAGATILLSLMIARQAFQSVDVPAGTRERFGLHKYSVVFFETMCVLFAAALSYPFYRQTSSYARLGKRRSSDEGLESDTAQRAVLAPNVRAGACLVDRAGLPVIGGSDRARASNAA